MITTAEGHTRRQTQLKPVCKLALKILCTNQLTSHSNILKLAETLHSQVWICLINTPSRTFKWRIAFSNPSTEKPCIAWNAVCLCALWGQIIVSELNWYRFVFNLHLQTSAWHHHIVMWHGVHKFLHWLIAQSFHRQHMHAAALPPFYSKQSEPKPTVTPEPTVNDLHAHVSFEEDPDYLLTHLWLDMTALCVHIHQPRNLRHRLLAPICFQLRSCPRQLPGS